MKYKVIACEPSNLENKLNEYAKQGYLKHEIQTDGNGSLRVVFSKCQMVASEIKEFEPAKSEEDIVWEYLRNWGNACDGAVCSDCRYSNGNTLCLLDIHNKDKKAFLENYRKLMND